MALQTFLHTRCSKLEENYKERPEKTNRVYLLFFRFTNILNLRWFIYSAIHHFHSIFISRKYVALYYVRKK